MSDRRVLIAGIGNIFLGDDAFGVEVIRQLRPHSFSDLVQVRDFGIRGLDLRFALESCRAAILVDAATRGHPPGTLAVIEPRIEYSEQAHLEPHRMTPDLVLAGIPPESRPGLIRVITCEPESLEPNPDGLSDVVKAAVGPACALVFQIVEELLGGVRSHA